jgi:hypothetical protein
VRVALGDHAALGHDDDPVGDVPHHVHVVLDEQHGHPLVLEVEDLVEQRLRQRRVDAGHRLVEHDQLRLAHEGAGHLEQLALTTGSDAAKSSALASSLNLLEQAMARSSISSSCLRQMPG